MGDDPIMSCRSLSQERLRVHWLPVRLWKSADGNLKFDCELGRRKAESSKQKAEMATDHVACVPLSESHPLVLIAETVTRSVKHTYVLCVRMCVSKRARQCTDREW